jgi:UDP-2,3-diacylglucosamine pyrophosphatase LpxH
VSTATDIYLVSDLHFGGDGQLQVCDFAAEFIALLKELERTGDAETELILAGDTFGLWEVTTVEGTAKLDEIVRHHGPIFDQIQATGARIRITLIPGNHDYDLACNPQFEAKLAEHNVTLDRSISLVRELGGRKIWIEHGQQSDVYNASPDYGNPYALPLGYFITEEIVSGASRYSAFGRGNWLKDIRSVGTTQIPDWLLSNYFYREMSHVLRVVATVFLLPFGLTLLALAAEALRMAGIVDANILLDNRVIRAMGIFGNILWLVIVINMLVVAFMLVAMIPVAVIYGDVLRTLRRFQLIARERAHTDVLSPAPYVDRAREVFARHHDVAVYVFGHTHEAFLSRENGRVILNTGTWLKILHRVSPRFRYMPAVYRPAFRLNYFHIRQEGRELVIRYVDLPKQPEPELSRLQRFVTWRRGAVPFHAIPALTRIDAGAPDQPPPTGSL